MKLYSHLHNCVNIQCYSKRVDYGRGNWEKWAKLKGKRI